MRRQLCQDGENERKEKSWCILHRQLSILDIGLNFNSIANQMQFCEYLNSRESAIAEFQNLMNWFMEGQTQVIEHSHSNNFLKIIIIKLYSHTYLAFNITDNKYLSREAVAIVLIYFYE